MLRKNSVTAALVATSILGVMLSGPAYAQDGSGTDTSGQARQEIRDDTNYSWVGLLGLLGLAGLMKKREQPHQDARMSSAQR